MSKNKRSEKPSKKSSEVKKGNERVYDKEFLKLKAEVIENENMLDMLDGCTGEEPMSMDYQRYLDNLNKRGEACEDDAEHIVAPSLERVLNESHKVDGSPLGRKLWGDESKGEAGLTWSELMEKMKKTL